MTSSAAELSLPPISVVMATLGGDSLKRTIDYLNSGTLRPDEILICIPEAEAPKVAHYSASNIRVIVTARRGQVAQRAVGFRSASNDYVMQLDDDLLVDEYCVESLLRVSSTQDEKTAVAPSFMWTSTHKSFYAAPNNNFLLRCYYWLLNGRRGYRPGTITAAGTNIGIDPSIGGDETFNVEWLAGGCVLHRKANLVLEDFYPFKGKAYCEDIIHSHHLKSRGVNLIVSAKAICWVEAPRLWEPPWREFFRGLMGDIRARRYFVRLTSRSTARMTAYYVLSILRYSSSRVIRKVKRAEVLTLES